MSQGGQSDKYVKRKRNEFIERFCSNKRQEKSLFGRNGVNLEILDNLMHSFAHRYLFLLYLGNTLVYTRNSSCQKNSVPYIGLSIGEELNFIFKLSPSFCSKSNAQIFELFKNISFFEHDQSICRIEPVVEPPSLNENSTPQNSPSSTESSAIENSLPSFDSDDDRPLNEVLAEIRPDLILNTVDQNLTQSEPNNEKKLMFSNFYIENNILNMSTPNIRRHK